ncbi:hypothetical protein WJU16_15905 [Chitinophaga pollutisoli]|uniref:Uncharacterized protein n=1 Tax=Chitinophaga pollutisoli TaxID=3133966 RepID=A0ABZ2YJR8_9BACT
MRKGVCNVDVSLDTFRDFLCLKGYRFRLLPGGHEQWEGGAGAGRWCWRDWWIRFRRLPFGMHCG